MDKTARIKRSDSGSEWGDAIGEIYSNAVWQSMAGRQHVTLFGQPIATSDDASLELQQKIKDRGVSPEGLLRAVRRKHWANVEC